MTNLVVSSEKKDFCFWVDPSNHFTFHNLSLIGYASNPAPSGNDIDSNLLFIPNPKYKGTITPYHNNIIKRIRAEYSLEMDRPKQYPSRTQALYLFETEEDAMAYLEIHQSHTEGRLLIRGSTEDEYVYSIHDSGWFDFLCKDASLDEKTIHECVNAYWRGITISQCQLQLYGKPWLQSPTFEVLFYGNLKISENSRNQLNEFHPK